MLNDSDRAFLKKLRGYCLEEKRVTEDSGKEWVIMK